MRAARFSGHLRVGVSAWGVYSPLWTEWLTDRCKNIILPQTSFTGGKYVWIIKIYAYMNE